MEKASIKYIFENLKNGDALFFYHRQWWAFFSKVIAVFTGGKIDHVGVCLDVSRSGNAVIFKLSEQTFTSGGKFEACAIFEKDGHYRFSGFSANQIVYGQLTKEATAKQVRIMLSDANEQVGAQYGKLTLLKTLNWFDSLFSKRQTAADTLRVCSTHAQVMYKKAGLISDEQFSKDDFYTPYELLTSGLFDQFLISDYNG